MSQPLYFESKPHHVFLLNKAIYGLRQAPIAWYEKLSTDLQGLNFVNSVSDLSLFVYKVGSQISGYLLCSYS